MTAGQQVEHTIRTMLLFRSAADVEDVVRTAFNRVDSVGGDGRKVRGPRTAEMTAERKRLYEDVRGMPKWVRR